MSPKPLVAALALSACTARELPPPIVPERVLTAAPTPTTEPPPGELDVTIETTSERAVVSEVDSAMSFTAFGPRGGGTAVGITSHVLCTTPCTTALPPGHHELVMAHADDGSFAGTATLDVGSRPVAYRYALGHASDHSGARIAGLTSLVFGVGLLATAPVVWGLEGAADENPFGMPTASPSLAPVIGTAIAGALLTALGIGLVVWSRPEIQNGAGTQWDLESHGARGGVTALRE